MHISDLKTIKPESVAFISYVMSNNYNISFDRLIVSTGLNIPFLKTTIKEVMRFTDGGNKHLEASIVYTNADKGNASALMVRLFCDGVLDKQNVTFIHFVMRPFCHETLEQGIHNFPMIKIPKKPCIQLH
jgi:hypothetical protein